MDKLLQGSCQMVTVFSCRLQMLMNSTEEDKAIASAAHPASLHPPSTTNTTPASAAPPSAAGDRATTSAGLLDGVHFVAIEESAEHVLHEVQPVFVVLYDVDLAWVRLLEVYKAQYPSRPLKVTPPPWGYTTTIVQQQQHYLYVECQLWLCP